MDQSNTQFIPFVPYLIGTDSSGEVISPDQFNSVYGSLCDVIFRLADYKDTSGKIYSDTVDLSHISGPEFITELIRLLARSFKVIAESELRLTDTHLYRELRMEGFPLRELETLVDYKIPEVYNLQVKSKLI